MLTPIENLVFLFTQVQHPGVRDLMMTDIRNLQAFVVFLQNTDIKFDMLSVTKEIEKQVLPFYKLGDVLTFSHYLLYHQAQSRVILQVHRV